MKNTKICPKCNGDNIVIIRNDGHPDGSNGNNIMTKSTILSGVAFVKRYICCYCGYTEEWIDQNDIKMIMNSKKIQK